MRCIGKTFCGILPSTCFQSSILPPVCQGSNSHYFYIIGNGHQPNSRGLFIYIPIPRIPTKDEVRLSKIIRILINQSVLGDFGKLVTFHEFQGCLLPYSEDGLPVDSSEVNNHGDCFRPFSVGLFPFQMAFPP